MNDEVKDKMNESIKPKNLNNLKLCHFLAAEDKMKINNIVICIKHHSSY